MSIMGRRVSVRGLIVLVTVIVLAGLIPVLSRSEVREIHLVTRDMAFYLEGDSQTPNPTLTVRAGESIRIVVRNDDQGLMHRGPGGACNRPKPKRHVHRPTCSLEPPSTEFEFA